jgi:hypothetical protein
MQSILVLRPQSILPRESTALTMGSLPHSDTWWDSQWNIAFEELNFPTTDPSEESIIQTMPTLNKNTLRACFHYATIIKSKEMHKQYNHTIIVYLFISMSTQTEAIT